MEVLSFSNIGKRENNEDYILVKDNVFIVCDGVGGVNKGEVASEFVATNFFNLISNAEVNEANLNVVVSDVQNKLKALVEGKEDEIGMGTTLATLLTANGVFYTCHIGDSRVYHFKPKTKEFNRTRDHSLVEELIASNHITEEEAQTHPKKNVITKALIADPNRENDLATINKIEDISEGDIFLICSDGVTEAWEDKHLTELFFNPANSLEDISDELQNQCNAFSNDNNSAILLKAEKDDIIKNINIEHQSSLTIQEDKSEYLSNIKGGQFNFLKILIPIILIGFIISFFVFNKESKSNKQPSIIKESSKNKDVSIKRNEQDTNIKPKPLETQNNTESAKVDVVSLPKKKTKSDNLNISNPEGKDKKHLIEKDKVDIKPNKNVIKPSIKNDDSLRTAPTENNPGSHE